MPNISQAGLQHGFTEGSGTRSSIIWNVRDAVKVKRPKFLCLENVEVVGNIFDNKELFRDSDEKIMQWYLED